LFIKSFFMNNPYEAGKEGYRISTDRSLLDDALIHHYLSELSYWAKGIPLETVKRSLDHSLCFGLYSASGQVGFARVVTDRSTFAYLADVFILEPYRGRGLSKWMMEVIHAHPELQGLRRWLLGTKDAHGLYAGFGWSSLTEDQVKRFMQRHDPIAYGKQPPL
jgi:GNAT superfamily N-acetyltransferase